MTYVPMPPIRGPISDRDKVMGLFYILASPLLVLLVLGAIGLVAAWLGY